MKMKDYLVKFKQLYTKIKDHQNGITRQSPSVHTLSGLIFAWIYFRDFSRNLAIFAKFCPQEIFKIAIFAKTLSKMKEIR